MLYFHELGANRQIRAMHYFLTWDGICYLTTTFPHHLKVMGYARELKQLGYRKQRCSVEWQSHLERTKSLILEAADSCDKKDKVLIVGSGLLFDIPIAELSRRFREVILVDILHLWKVRALVGRFSNVRLEALDVTGIVKKVYHSERLGCLPEVTNDIPKLFLGEELDLIVSANILSQLPVLLNGFSSRWKSKPTSGQVRGFSSQLVLNHLDWLSAFGGRVCLISDLERLHCDGDKVCSRERSLWGIELPEGGRKWEWNLAPRPEIVWNYDVRHLVIGYDNFPKQKWSSTRKLLNR